MSALNNPEIDSLLPSIDCQRESVSPEEEEALLKSPANEIKRMDAVNEICSENQPFVSGIDDKKVSYSDIYSFFSIIGRSSKLF